MKAMRPSAVLLCPRKRKCGLPYALRISGMMTLRVAGMMMALLGGLAAGWAVSSFAQGGGADMTEDKAYALAEEFGVDVGEVDEEIRDILGLTRAEGVVVFAVIGNTPADRAGIKVKAIIKEVDGREIRNLLELGRALEKALPTQNFSVATFEAAGIDDQGVSGGLNFHFVRVEKG